MTSLLDSDFLVAIALGNTFWRGVALPLLLAFLIAGAGAYALRRITCRRASASSLLTDDTGTAGAVDLVLTTPIIIAIVLPVIQLSLLAHASLVVHHSAYSAARSARVWYWDRDTAFIGGLGDVAGSRVNNFYVQSILSTESQKLEAMCHVKVAAKFALIAIAPASHPNVSQSDMPMRPNCGGAESNMRAILATLGNIPEDNVVREPGPVRIARTAYDGGAALIRKARYAFDDTNTIVIVNPLQLGDGVEEILADDDPQLDSVVVGIGNNIDLLQETFTASNAWRVRAEVEFRYWLHIPFAAALLGELQPEGFYARWLKAEVILL